MLRRGGLFSSVAVLGLCVIACAVTWFVGVPAFQDAVREDVEDGVATEVARRIPRTARGAAQPGSYVITQESLRRQLMAEAEDTNAQDVVLQITPSGLELGFTTRGQDVTYSGTPVAEDGRLVIRDIQTDTDWLGFILPADDLAQAIEDGVNGYLAENRLRLDAVELGDGAMTLTTGPAA